MTADERHLNPGGTVHGGAIATLVDIAMGVAVLASSDDAERPVTIEMKINFLDAAKPRPEARRGQRAPARQPLYRPRGRVHPGQHSRRVRHRLVHHISS